MGSKKAGAASAIPGTFNVMIVGQSGRLQYEALLFVASLRHHNPDFPGRVFVATPQEGPRWNGNPAITQPEVLDELARHGAEILPFESRHFGHSYPYGNKIEALMALPKGEPFVFFDTDTLITGDLMSVPFDFDKPTASLKREGTWPKIELYGPGYTEIWKSLYDKFGLDFDSSLDLSQPDEYWKRYLYFNAGFFFYKCPHEFGQRYLEYALAIRDDAPKALVCQPMDPWLDQVALPLVIHSFGGGRDALPEGYLDGTVSFHYRLFPLLYAKGTEQQIECLEELAAPNKLKKVLKGYEPIKKLVYQRKGQKVRALFDLKDMPVREQAIRKRIKAAGLWLR